MSCRLTGRRPIGTTKILANFRNFGNLSSVAISPAHNALETGVESGLSESFATTSSWRTRAPPEGATSPKSETKGGD